MQIYYQISVLTVTHVLCSPIVDQRSGDCTPLKKRFQDQKGKFSLLPGQLQPSMMPFGLTVNTRESSLKTHAGETAYKEFENAGYDGLGSYSFQQALKVGQHCETLLMPLLPSSHLENPSYSTGAKYQPQAAKSKEDNCKLRGIHLNSNLVPSKLVQLLTTTTNESESYTQPALKQLQSWEPNLRTDPWKGTNSAETAVAGREQGKPFQSFTQNNRDGQSKLQGAPTRSCTKVFLFRLLFSQ